MPSGMRDAYDICKEELMWCRILIRKEVLYPKYDHNSYVVGVRVGVNVTTVVSVAVVLVESSLS